MEYNVPKLIATTYRHATECAKVINDAEFDIYTWIRLEKFLTLFGEIDSVYELVDDKRNEVDKSSFEVVSGAWVRVESSRLNRSAGLHMYLMNIVDTVTGDTIPHYFSYIVQKMPEEKSYIYMNRESEEDDTEH